MKKGMKFYNDKKFWIWFAMAVGFGIAVYFGYTKWIEANPEGSFF